MDFKLFMNSVEENLSLIKTEEELRNWIRNYARSIPEEERGSFLEQIQIRKSRSHKEILQELTDWCAKIEEGEITLSCSGYEEYGEYGESWWDRDWVTEYEDPMGIGLQLKHYYEEAEQAVYDRDYESASQMYWNLGALNITADDIYGGEPAELGIEEMVSEKLVSLNLKQIASLTLYSTYQAYELPERMPKLYGFFSWPMFKDTGIEDMMAAGREPLHEINEFLETWIAYLREQNDSYTSRLLIEAVTFRGGTEGLLEEAKRTANQHPGLYIQVLDQFFKDGEWKRLRDEGMEALRRMDRNMEIRDKAARMTAAGATHTGDSKTAAEALKEAFCSKSTAENYFRVLTCGAAGCGRDDMKRVLELTERLQQEQKERQKQDNAGEGYVRYYRREPKETDSYRQTDQDRLGIHFLDGDYEAVWRECRKTKNALGWTGEFISEGVPMLLAFLCENDFEGRGMQAMLSDIEQYIGYKEEYDEPEFSERFLSWKKQIVISEDVKKEILIYLIETIDARVEAIVGGSHRGSYYKAARLGAALGEVEESMGKTHGKAERVSKYLAEFPRHRAFKQEMKAYM